MLTQMTYFLMLCCRETRRTNHDSLCMCSGQTYRGQCSIRHRKIDADCGLRQRPGAVMFYPDPKRAKTSHFTGVAPQGSMGPMGDSPNEFQLGVCMHQIDHAASHLSCCPRDNHPYHYGLPPLGCRAL